MIAPDRPEFRSSKRELKSFNDAAHKLQKLMHGWKNRLTFENIAERYIKSEIRIIVRLRAIFGFQPEEYFAIFQRAGTANEPTLTRSNKGAHWQRIASLSVNNGVVGGEGYQKPMFIYDVQLVQFPECLSPPPLYGLRRAMRSSTSLLAPLIFPPNLDSKFFRS